MPVRCLITIELDVDTAWSTIVDDLPYLKENVERILKAL